MDIRPLLKVASGVSSETLVPIYQTTTHYMSDEGNVYSRSRTNLQYAVPSINPVTALQYLITGSLLFGKTVSPAGYEILTVTVESAIDSYIRYEWGVFAVNPMLLKRHQLAAADVRNSLVDSSY